MNYIKKLQRDVGVANGVRETLLDGLSGMKAYLTSEKFQQDSTVQVADVLRRLDEVISQGYDFEIDVLNAFAEAESTS